MTDLRTLTLALALLAVVLRSEVFFYLLYVLLGLQLAAWLWVRRLGRGLRWAREAPPAAFPGEPIEVRLVIQNQSLLPLPWLVVHESVPAELRVGPGLREVLGLGAGGRRELRYTLQGRRRGLYRLGPLSLGLGDVFGLREQSMGGGASDPLVIYPPVLPLPDLGLPAGLPFGRQPRPQSLFSDPARPIGVREYQRGDGMRQIDWKSSAHAGALQVRRYEPAIARETVIALAFSLAEYPGRYTYDGLERAVVAAASIAADLAARRQPVGLCSSGLDQLSEAPARPIGPGVGQAHMLGLLGLLGRLAAPPAGNILAVAEAAAAGMSWGSTLVLICSGADAALVERLLLLRRRGLLVALVLAEGSAAELGLARSHGIPAYQLSRAGAPEPS